jgi:hypothetical protein
MVNIIRRALRAYKQVIGQYNGGISGSPAVMIAVFASFDYLFRFVIRYILTEFPVDAQCASR